MYVTVKTNPGQVVLSVREGVSDQGICRVREFQVRVGMVAWVWLLDLFRRELRALDLVLVSS